MTIDDMKLELCRVYLDLMDDKLVKKTFKRWKEELDATEKKHFQDAGILEVVAWNIRQRARQDFVQMLGLMENKTKVQHEGAVEIKWQD